MNAMRLLGTGMLACLLAAGALAEEKADNAKLIVGKWEVTKADEGAGVPVGATVEFTKDGKMKAVVKENGEEKTHEATYKVEGDKFTMVMKKGDQERSQTITIKKLTKTELSTLGEDGKAVELKRKK